MNSTVKVCKALKKLTLILFILGLGLITAIAAWLGFGSVAKAFFSIGIGGFSLLILWQLGVDLVLGLAWQAVYPPLGFIRLTLSRLVREAAISCLPFSVVGGLLISIRATSSLSGTLPHKTPISWAEAASANIIDITTEVMGLAFYVLLGLLCLFVFHPSSDLEKPALIGAGLLVVGTIGFVWTQKNSSAVLSRFAKFLGKFIAGSWKNTVVNGVDSFQTYLDYTWDKPSWVGKSAFLHAIGWIANTGSTWLAFRFLGVPLSFTDAMVIEALTCAITSATFIVPGNLGVQEAAYITMGAVYGINPDLSFSVSLLRRARDMTIGFPVLLIWQGFELSSLKRKKKPQSYTPSSVKNSPVSSSEEAKKISSTSPKFSPDITS